MTKQISEALARIDEAASWWAGTTEDVRIITEELKRLGKIEAKVENS